MADQPPHGKTTAISGTIQQITVTPLSPTHLNLGSSQYAAEPGARLIMDYMDRHEPAFGMIEIEIDALAMFNTATTGLFSLGMGTLGFAISRFSDLISMTIPQEQKGWAYATAIGSLVFAIGLMIVAGILATKKSTMKNKLIRKARARFQSASGPDPLEDISWWRKWIIMRLAPRILDNLRSKAP